MSAGQTTRLDYRQDYADLAESRLLRQWQDKPRLVAFARALGAGTQRLEDILWAIHQGSTLDNSDSHRLDQWGDLVGERRGGLNDIDYRRFIKARIRANRSTGKWDEILEILILVTDPIAVRSRDIYPCGMEITILRHSFLSRPVWSKVRDLARTIKPAGTRMIVTEVAGPFFGFLGDPWGPMPLGSGIVARGILS